jgi:predicted metalloprotease with PDZ domain
MKHKLLFTIAFIFMTALASGQKDVKLVGVEFGMKGKAIVVTGKFVGAPAAEAPLYPGDTLVAIEGRQVKDMTLEEAFKFMHDQSRDTVLFTI